MLTWEDPKERIYHTGLSRAAIYMENGAVAWNGVIAVEEQGEGQTSVLYRDGHIFFADVEASDFNASVTAYSWPDAFSRCLGIPEVTDGLYVDNQKPRRFGFAYRTLIGSGAHGDRFGYQIHLVYNAVASIGSRSRKTRTNSPSLNEFSFNLVCTPVKLPGMRPSAHYIIDTRNLDKSTIAELEAILYGDVDEPRLPEPIELFDLMNFGESITFTDNGDGTWTARGARSNLIDHGNGTWTIKNVNATNNGDGTFTAQDTN